jgi:type VI secretion system secreted protein Hcp
MATRMFLKLGDIKGSSQDDKSHKDWIEVESFGYGVSNSVNATEKAKGNPGGEACIHSDVSMSKVIDKTSPLLYAYCSSGKVFDKATIECNEEEELLFKLTLTNAAISSVSVSGGTSGVPAESLVLSFSKVAWQYKNEAEQHWDQVSNKGSLKKK